MKKIKPCVFDDCEYFSEYEPDDSIKYLKMACIFCSRRDGKFDQFVER